ncbi:MAG: M42 family metallopeptidase [Planctomycetota bacterium]|jgi:endoglucanase|nr:M42 family metallopeptidase [Planctomycetota bacterium]
MTPNDPRREQILATLRQLSEAPGVPGHEDPVREIFLQAWKDVGPLQSDRLGSLVCRSDGSQQNPSVLIDCHIDETGFLVQSIDENGFLRVVPLGSWWGHVLLSQRVQIQTRTGSVPGTFSAPPPHLLPRSAREKVVGVKDLRIDIGAESRQQAEEEFGIRLGNPVSPSTPFLPLAHPDRFSGKAFDNRAGSTVVLQTLLEAGTDHPNTLFGVASVQEEVGCRGATTAVRLVDPDIALVIEGSPADDLPGVKDQGRQGQLGKGTQIRLFDPRLIANPFLADLAIRTAEEEKIPHQISVNPTGGTDGRPIHLHDRGVPTIVLGVPVRSIHCHVGSLDLRDLIATIDLTLALIRRLDPPTVEAIHQRRTP